MGKTNFNITGIRKYDSFLATQIFEFAYLQPFIAFRLVEIKEPEQKFRYNYSVS
jgi:hypothetical protein